jgi:hypothetical protein
MKKIILFEMRLMHNNEFAEFLSQADGLINQHSPETLGIATLYPAFASALNLVLNTLQVRKGSSKTVQLNKCIQQQNRSFRGIKLHLDSFAYHYNPEVVEAARVVSHLFKKYGNINRKSIIEKSSAITHLVAKITLPPYDAMLETLNLTPWVDQLSNDNKALKSIFDERANEVSSRPNGNVHLARNEAEPAYLALVNRINALAEVNGDEAYALFIDKLNVYANNYIIAIKKGKGRRKKRSEKAAEGEGTTVEG